MGPLAFDYSDNSGNHARPQGDNLVAVQRRLFICQTIVGKRELVRYDEVWSAFMAHTSVGAFFPAQTARTLSPAGPSF